MAVFIVLVQACSVSEPEPPPRRGAWYAADLHLHTSVGSNDTDGISGVAEYVSVAQERGIDLLIFTDHSNSAGSMACETGDVEDCPNQGPEFPVLTDLAHMELSDVHVAVGVEISPVASLDNSSIPTGHIGCLPKPGSTFSNIRESVIDRPVGSGLGGVGVEWCHQQDGFAVLNHPYALAPWIAYDWTNDNYDAIEIFNGGARFDAGDQQSLAA